MSVLPRRYISINFHGHKNIRQVILTLQTKAGNRKKVFARQMSKLNNFPVCAPKLDATIYHTTRQKCQ